MLTGLIAGGVSGLVGAGIDAWSNYEANKAAQKGARDAANATADAWKQLYGNYQANEGVLSDYESQLGRVYSPEMIDAVSKQYMKVLATDPSSFAYNPTDFNYGKTIEDFYDKAWETNSNAQQRALERSAANAGGLYSSGLAANTASLVSANALNAYKDARDAYFQDKSLAQQQWKAYNQMLMNQSQSRLGAYQAMGQNLGGALDTGVKAWGDLASARVSNNNSAADAYANMMGTYTNLVSQAGGRNVNKFGSFTAPAQGGRLY